MRSFFVFSAFGVAGLGFHALINRRNEEYYHADFIYKQRYLTMSFDNEKDFRDTLSEIDGHDGFGYVGCIRFKRKGNIRETMVDDKLDEIIHKALSF